MELSFKDIRPRRVPASSHPCRPWVVACTPTLIDSPLHPREKVTYLICLGAHTALAGFVRVSEVGRMARGGAGIGSIEPTANVSYHPHI